MKYNNDFVNVNIKQSMLLSPNIKMVLELVQYLTKTIPQNMWFFWSNPYKTEIMLTSLI